MASDTSLSLTHTHSFLPIKSFKHCVEFAFCFELPELCPVCQKSLLTTAIKVPPFVLPSPFLSSEPGISLLVKPSGQKDFFTHYQEGDGLHCGILDTQGLVHDFDETGLHCSIKWPNSIIIPIKGSDPIHEHHQVNLLENAKYEWLISIESYDQENANCFTFALWILKRLNLLTGLEKDEFLEKVILPVTKEAANYIKLYRNILSSGGVFISSKPQ